MDPLARPEGLQATL